MKFIVHSDLQKRGGDLLSHDQRDFGRFRE